MTQEEARKHLIDWVSYVENPNSIPDFDQPCSADEIIESMKIGAEALSKSELPEDLEELNKKAVEMADTPPDKITSEGLFAAFNYFFLAGKEFRRKQDQEVIDLPEGLEEAAEKASKTWRRNEDGSESKELFPQTFVRGFIAGAEYQRKQDQQLIELAEDHAMLAGMNKMKEEMMKNVVEGRVIKSYNPVTAIGQPTLHGIELIYPDKGKSYLVAGDKVKMIVIPEEK